MIEFATSHSHAKERLLNPRADGGTNDEEASAHSQMLELTRARSARFRWPIWLAFMMLILVARSLPAPIATENQDHASYEPDEFYYSTSQLFSGTTEILWKDHALIFRSRPAGDPSKVNVITRRLVPNSHQWAEFWQTMDRLGAWSWHGDYQGGLGNLPDPRFTVVRIRHGNQAMKMLARDGGPKGFNELVSAIDRLVQR